MSMSLSADNKYLAFVTAEGHLFLKDLTSHKNAICIRSQDVAYLKFINQEGQNSLLFIERSNPETLQSLKISDLELNSNKFQFNEFTKVKDLLSSEILAVSADASLLAVLKDNTVTAYRTSDSEHPIKVFKGESIKSVHFEHSLIFGQEVLIATADNKSHIFSTGFFGESKLGEPYTGTKKGTNFFSYLNWGARMNTLENAICNLLDQAYDIGIEAIPELLTLFQTMKLPTSKKIFMKLRNTLEKFDIEIANQAFFQIAIPSYGQLNKMLRIAVESKNNCRHVNL
jgi:hypothetical protein